ncbi:MAG TPA: ATP-binding protein [Myxococcaceae bacterium]|jgi:PAS domain S-box-containing protein
MSGGGEQRKVSLDELRAAIELFAHPICVVSGQRLVACNQAMLDATGYPREEAIGKHYSELLPPEERRRLSELAFRRAQGEALPAPDFALMQTRSRSVLPVQFMMARLPSDDGRVLNVASGLVASAQQAELDLAERLAEVAALLMAQRSPKSIRQAAVLAFERARLWAGFYAAANGALSPLVISSPEQAPPVDPVHAFNALYDQRPVFSAAGAGGSAAQVAYLPLRHPGGEEVLVLAGSITPRSSGVLRLFAEQMANAYSNAQLIADLETGHRETRLLLELAQTTAQSLEAAGIMDAAADFVVRLLDAHAAFIYLLDEDKRSLRVRAVSTSVRADFPAESSFPLGDPASVVGRVARDRAPVAIGDVAAAPEGDYSRTMADRYGVRSVLGVPMLSREELVGVLLVTDARARPFEPKQIELAQATASQLALAVTNARLVESLRQRNTMLQETRAAMVKRERLAALGELSAVVAHEVRNPLGVIFNSVSSLRRLLPKGEPEKFLDYLAEESDRLNRLVGELLDFARPRALFRQAEDVGRVIQDALEAAGADPASANANVHLTAEVEPGLPPVPMDRRQLHQALVNVSVNALQSMPKGGSLRVLARRDGVEPGGGPQLRIDLCDDGPGIGQSDLPRIFEPFFTTKAKGTGLGLAVVKRIIEDHEGTVEVRSEVGRGTTFTFRLPIQG